MRFLIGTAFAVLLAVAVSIVALGVVNALRTTPPDEDA